ncbi:MAG TPA: VWA domain-containing protein [Bryobacteraceae bacterium]|nr:VWA domain-containing protein [Bryobacteraceae bacterium]
MSKLIVSTLFLSLFAMWAADRRAGTDIRVNVNMALVPVSVTDGYGRNVTGLNPQNFRIYEGSRQVDIASFSQLDQPITVGLVFDCSGSMKDKFRIAREAPRELFKQLNADDESFLITVSSKAELKQSLTGNFGDLESSLIFTNPNGTTSLLDGIYMALQQIRKSPNRQKALVVVTDGGENNSRYTQRELTRLAVESDTQIFSAGIYDRPQSKEEEDGPALMTELCGKTGGFNYIVRDTSELRDTMAKIGVTLHNQYLIGYYPPDGEGKGKFRKIRVQLLLPTGLPPLNIHARGGYYIPE